MCAVDSKGQVRRRRYLGALLWTVDASGSAGPGQWVVNIAGNLDTAGLELEKGSAKQAEQSYKSD